MNETIDLLLTRRSGRARDMVGPGPTKQQLGTILKAGMRVPDHGKLAPWRFVVFEAMHERSSAKSSPRHFRLLILKQAKRVLHLKLNVSRALKQLSW